MNLGDDFIKEVSDKIASTINEIGEQDASKLKDFPKRFNEYGGISGFFGFALNSEERECDLITFSECLKWIKYYLNPEIHGGAVIYRKANEKDSSIEGYKLILKVCFLGKDGNLLSDNSSPNLTIKCVSIDDDLRSHFGSKDIIVLR